LVLNLFTVSLIIQISRFSLTKKSVALLAYYANHIKELIVCCIIRALYKFTFSFNN